jgi:UDPglucose--hexose-1-phosphate uridylyltransferase
VSINWTQDPHRRYNALTGEWVLVSPHRTQRPWQGQVEKTPGAAAVEYDPSCYLCPGNPRAGGHRNPPYTTTFVFDNDFAALRPDTPPGDFHDGLLTARAEPGICRVVCFSPRHHLTVSRMDLGALRTVVDTWVDQYVQLGAMPFINSVQIFENRGEMMGASNPHPHCQIWANESIPVELAKEQAALDAHHLVHDTCLLCDYAAIEEQRRDRVVCSNAEFLCVVPFWAVWPFETLVIPRTHLTAIDELPDVARDALAAIMKQITAAYDALFDVSFPYTMGFHQRPTDGHPHPEWHLHAHYYPPLLRSATVRKFMVGYEMLANPQRDITPESAAARLREIMDR